MEDSYEVLYSRAHSLRYGLDRWRTMRETMEKEGLFGPWLFAIEPACQTRWLELQERFKTPEHHKMHYALEKVYQCRQEFARSASWQPFELLGKDEQDKQMFEQKIKEVFEALYKLEIQAMELRRQQLLKQQEEQDEDL